MTANDNGLQTWQPQPLLAADGSTELGEQQALFAGEDYYVAGTDWPFLSLELLGDDDAHELLTTLDEYRARPRGVEASS